LLLGVNGMKMFNPFKQEYEEVTPYNMWELQAYELFLEGYSAEEVATSTILTLAETRRLEERIKTLS